MLRECNNNVRIDDYNESPPKKVVMPHDKFIARIKKSLYYGDEENREKMKMEISRPLAEYASELFSASHRGYSLNRLNAVAAGSCHAPPCSLIIALIYLDRLNAINPEYSRRITPQELFIVSMMISTKFYSGYDEEICLDEWACDGDMTKKRLKQLELDFLEAIDWNIYVSNEQFFEKLTNVEKTLARREGLRRGWLTYTELMQLLPSFTVAKFIFNNITVMAVSYAASVMTIAGAFFLVSQVPGSAWHHEPADELATTAESVFQGTTTVLLPATPPSATTTKSGTGATGAATQARLNANCYKRCRKLRSNSKKNCTGSIALTSDDDNLAADDLRRSSCFALKIEAEMLKLESHYHREANRENNLKDYPKPLDTVATVLHTNGESLAGPYKSKTYDHLLANSNDDGHRQWYAHKEEYSDKAKASESPRLDQCSDWYNCTRNIFFWKLIGDSDNHASFLRLPSMWFKFI